MMFTMDDATAMHWRCYDCNMTFSNPSLLQKHRARFCVGGGLGDPDQLMLRRGFRSELPQGGGDVPDDPDPTKYNPQSDPKVRQLAENHGRQMEHLQNRNRDLERQREEIRRRLENLGHRPIKDDDSMNALLQELKDQEARNQKMLEELRRILASQNIHIPVETKKQQYIYPIYYGNSLVAEIIAVRQAYLQNGGNDPDILQQLAQMQAEAQAIDDSLRNRPPPKQKEKQNANHSLLTLELENERLQRQLLLLQEQNIQAKHRRKDDREGMTRARAILNHAVPKERAKTFSEAQPLDVRSDLILGNTRSKTTDRSFMREKWITRIDPFKEKIDSDVQNKFGYDYGANRFLLTQPAMPAEDRSQSYKQMATLLPEETQDVVPVKLVEPSEPKTKYIYQSDRRETPYFRNHLTSRKLNRVERDLRDSYSRTSQVNIQSDEAEQMDMYFQRKQAILATNPTAEINLSSHESNNLSDKITRGSTKFEDEFFLNTARTEVDDEGHDISSKRRPPQPRPKVLEERNSLKKIFKLFS